MSISLDPDQARHSVGPDLCPDCLERLSADNTKNKELQYLQVIIRDLWHLVPNYFMKCAKLFVIMKNSADPVEMSL